ncbi:hypothetical protein [Nibricoccus aquaticus]|nr:hypothetical protein [Nibricoccus aquaticus]
MIIDKADGSVHKLGSAFTLERDLAAFDQGFRFGAAYLVVHKVGDLTGAVNELLKVRITEAVPEFAHGVEWRIPKPLTSKDIEARLRALPAKFGPISVYFSVESLQ